MSYSIGIGRPDCIVNAQRAEKLATRKFERTHARRLRNDP